MSWICIYINVVIISRYLCTGSFVMISLLVFLVIMKNVVISFITEYRGPTLRPPCDVIDDVNMKILSLAKFGTIFSYLMSDWSCVKYFKIFKMAVILNSRLTFFTGNYTGSWIHRRSKVSVQAAYGNMSTVAHKTWLISNDWMTIMLHG